MLACGHRRRPADPPQAARFLVTPNQDQDLLVVKANQPTLLARLTRLAWDKVPVADRTRDHGHGRVELGTLKAVTVNHFGLPSAAKARPGHPQDL